MHALTILAVLDLPVRRFVARLARCQSVRIQPIARLGADSVNAAATDAMAMADQWLLIDRDQLDRAETTAMAASLAASGPLGIAVRVPHQDDALVVEVPEGLAKLGARAKLVLFSFSEHRFDLLNAVFCSKPCCRTRARDHQPWQPGTRSSLALLEQAKALASSQGGGSISLFQRELRIGYSHADALLKQVSHASPCRTS